MIKNIGIIGGSGKIGTTFKNAFESVGLNVIVTDHATKDQENDLINKSEWIILCVPIDKTLEVFHSVKNKIRKDQVFSDFTSVKSILGDKLFLNFQVDNKIIGGLIVKIGSKMVDSSIASKINKLKLSLKEA